MIIRRKAELTEYIAPGPAADLYGSIQKKAEFYEVCEKFGIPYPDSKILTAPVDAADLTEDKLGLPTPSSSSRRPALITGSIRLTR